MAVPSGGAATSCWPANGGCVKGADKITPSAASSGGLMFRFAPVAVVLAAGVTLVAAQRPADDNAFPHTKPNGRATVQYQDEKVQAVAIYDYSQRNHDGAWL